MPMPPTVRPRDALAAITLAATLITSPTIALARPIMNPSNTRLSNLSIETTRPPDPRSLTLAYRLSKLTPYATKSLAKSAPQYQAGNKRIKQFFQTIVAIGMLVWAASAAKSEKPTKTYRTTCTTTYNYPYRRRTGYDSIPDKVTSTCESS